MSTKTTIYSNDALHIYGDITEDESYMGAMVIVDRSTMDIQDIIESLHGIRIDSFQFYRSKQKTTIIVETNIEYRKKIEHIFKKLV